MSQTATAARVQRTDQRQPLLEARGIVKRFGRVEALRGADFAVYPEEIVALIGDNGAGKSTLVKILSGALEPDAGTVLLDGDIVDLVTPSTARHLGIETVYQDLALADDLDPVTNVFLGREIVRPGLLGRLGFLDRPRMRAAAAETFSTLGLTVTTESRAVRGLSGGQKQGVAVCRAVNWAQRAVLMDEPTAALGVVQTQKVLELVARVRDTGRSVILISHNMPDVLAVADRIEVLRLGQRVATFRRGEATMHHLVAAMTGAVTQDLGGGQP